MTDPIPYFTPQRMRCKRGHAWVDHLPQHVLIKVWVAHVKAMRCPECGMGPKGLFLVYEPDQAEPET